MLTHSGTADLQPFWNDVDPQVVETLDEFQKEGILAALSRRASENHSADVRLSCFGYYLVAIFGRERRNGQRREVERLKRPVFTVRNLPLIILLWGSLVYTAFSFILPGLKELLVLAL